MLDFVVVMGVSGSGKSTVGRELAARLAADFLEGDDLHPAQNVARMASGIALTDEDRHGWLETLAARLTLARAQGRGLVISCSALKRSYRDILRQGAPNLLFVHLSGDSDLLAARMARRPGHYMPSSLLDSQFAALEPPGADENALTLDVEQSVELIVSTIVERLRP
ncbi:MAG: gluconokinase [Polaromonas sp.]